MTKPAKFLIIFTVLALLQSCASIANTPSQSTDVESTLIGHYVYGHEVNTFQPCGSNRDFWVIGSSEILKTLEVNYLSLSSTHYDPVFVELIGNMMATATDGFAADYDGLAEVKRLVLMRKKSNLDCKN